MATVNLNKLLASKIYKPEVLDLANHTDFKRYEEILNKNPHIEIFDTYQEQLAELIETRHPSQVLTKDEIAALSNDYMHKQGSWIYYPWANRLVKTLNKNDFIELRTSRNCYKITPEEQAILKGKRIGIVGLSVGQSVALTIAMERCCGELRLADFDTVSLSNLNRIRAGIHQIGVPKVYTTAREIVEIDPYFDVSCFTNGVTQKNMNEFLVGSGKLDILIEMCDSFEQKYILRTRAKELGIPVLMETNERGIVDIERFDLEPERPILHGRVGEIPFEKLISMTPAEKIELGMQMVGKENLTERMIYSLSEIRKSIKTWPQLASSVVMGGAVTCSAARRMLLNQLTKSGRYIIDLDELINDKK